MFQGLEALAAAFAFALVSLYCPKKPFLFRESFFVSNSRDKRFTLSQIFSNSESRELFSVSSSLGCSMRTVAAYNFARRSNNAQ